jgi:hypothetical protein
MAIYLTADQLYRLFQRELPEGAYADGEYPKWLTTSSVYAKAKTFKDTYDNMALIANNNFPQTAEEKIDDWAVKTFGAKFAGGTTLSAQREAIIAKIRSQPDLTKWNLLTKIVSFLAPGTFAQIFFDCNVTPPVDSLVDVDFSDWCNFVQNLHWRLGVDRLGASTFLGIYPYLDVVNRQAAAFMYKIRIFAPITDAVLNSIDLTASVAEPARSAHTIDTNQVLADFGLVTTVNNVDQFSLVDCICTDPTQTTGYRGLIT